MGDRNYWLLIDDDDGIHYLSRFTLNRVGCQAELIDCPDGADAVDLIRGAGPPEFVILDLRMPRMDGLQFLSWASRNKTMADSKILLMTSSELQRDREAALKYRHVVGFVPKPLSEEDIATYLMSDPILRGRFSAGAPAL
jgi:CheY-like chemotaxis protein